MESDDEDEAGGNHVDDPSVYGDRNHSHVGHGKKVAVNKKDATNKAGMKIGKDGGEIIVGIEKEGKDLRTMGWTRYRRITP